MKILFIPEQNERNTIARIPSLMMVLSKRHSLTALPSTLLHSPHPIFDRPFKIVERLAELFKALFLNCDLFDDVDIVFASQGRHALIGSIIAKKLRRPFIFDSHGNPELLCRNLNAGYFFRLRNILPEKNLLGKTKKIITVSETDRIAYIRMGFNENTVEVIPTCVDFDDVNSIAKAEARNMLGLPVDIKIILFLGSYNYFPNLEAANFINDRLAPSFPEAKIILAGRGKLDIPFKDNVDFRGFVDNLGPYISASDICIAPIWRGVGILEKVLQMMAYGKPTVVTPFALLGIPELENNKNCLVADTEAGFADKIRALIAGADLGQSIGDNAKELILKKYNWSLFEEILFRVIESAR
ncbi:MAG: glycosyltransferase family 4 protein [Pseudomonadota bacterium]